MSLNPGEVQRINLDADLEAEVPSNTEYSDANAAFAVVDKNGRAALIIGKDGKVYANVEPMTNWPPA